MTSWLESQKNNEADKTSDPIQSNPWMNPIHVQL